MLEELGALVRQAMTQQADPLAASASGHTGHSDTGHHVTATDSSFNDTLRQVDNFYRFIGFPSMALTGEPAVSANLSLVADGANNVSANAWRHTSSEEGQFNNISAEMDDTTDAYSKPWPFLKQPTFMIVILSTAYLIVFVLGVVNNSLVVSVIYRNPQLRTVTNYFIANLAVADILVCILVLPITLLSNIFTEWWYGPVLCRMAPYLQGVAVGASVNTLAAVAVERYLAIFYPHTQRLSPRAAVIMIVGIWILPMGIFIPWIKVYQIIYHHEQQFVAVLCTAVWHNKESEKMYTLGAVFLTCYLMPLIFIAICYLLIGVRVWNRKVKGIRGSRTERNINRSKIRIVRMLMVVFVIFSIWWLPLYAIQLYSMFGPDFNQHRYTYDILKNYVMPFAQWLGASNSCVNPFVYCYFSTSFRRSIITAIRSGSCCGKITA